MGETMGDWAEQALPRDHPARHRKPKPAKGNGPPDENQSGEQPEGLGKATERFWTKLHFLFEAWEEIWKADREKYKGEYPVWMVNAAEELFAHDMCDAWSWNDYTKAALVIIQRHYSAATPVSAGPVMTPEQWLAKTYPDHPAYTNSLVTSTEQGVAEMCAAYHNYASQYLRERADNLQEELDNGGAVGHVIQLKARAEAAEKALRWLLDSIPHHEGDDNLTEPIELARKVLGEK